MNYKYSPATEYKMLEDFYADGSSDQMPPQLEKLETIYQEAWKHLKLGFLSYKKIAKMVQGKFQGYGLSYRNAYNHVCNAAAYYAQAKKESKDLHRARLTELLYKQAKLIQDTVARHEPIKAAAELRSISKAISDLNGVYEPELPEDMEAQEIIFLLHDDAKKIPGIKAIPEGRLVNEIEQMAKQFELDEEEKNKIIQQDVYGGLPTGG